MKREVALNETGKLPYEKRFLLKEIMKVHGREKDHQFYAVFDRFGILRKYDKNSRKTVLLKKVIHAETGELVADHIWIRYSYRTFKNITGVEKGDIISFWAKISRYIKVDEKHNLNHALWVGEGIPKADYALYNVKNVEFVWRKKANSKVKQ